MSGALRRVSPLARDLALLVAAFAVLRVLAVAGLGAHRFNDTRSYFSFDLLGDRARLWTVPLLFKAMPGDPARVAAQTAIGVVGWSALAVESARALRNPALARAAAALVLLLGLTTAVTKWDLALLSESLVLSLTALGAALMLWLARRGASPALLGGLLGVVTLWTFTRYVSAVAVAALFPLAAAVVVWRLPRRTALPAVAFLLLLSAWALYAVSREKFIWRANAYDLVVERILRDPAATRYFEHRGLVVTPALRRASREHLPVLSPAFLDPRFQSWLYDRWRPAYRSYLLSHLPDTLWQPLRQTPDQAAKELLYASPRRVLPRAAEDVLWTRPAAFLALAGGSLLLWLLSLLRGPPRPAELVPWGLVVLGLVQAELVWNYAAKEMGRLYVPAGAALRLGFLLVALFALDRGLRSGTSPDSSAG